MYDSLYSNQDTDTLSAISWLLEVHRPPVIINLMKIGKQKGGNDCGLFAVAVLTALAFGVNVTKVKFDQGRMRPHLHYRKRPSIHTVYSDGYYDVYIANTQFAYLHIQTLYWH